MSMTNEQFIHHYAQIQSDSKEKGNLFYEGKKIYSYGYHYLLGEFIDNRTIVINDTGYSNTTSKHIGILINATTQYKQFFKSSCDLDTVHSTILSLKKSLATARKPLMYSSRIIELFNSLNNFLEYTKAKKYKSNAKYKEVKKIYSLITSNDNFLAEIKAEQKRVKAKKAKKDAKELKETLKKFYAYEKRIFRLGKDFVRLSKDGRHVETNQGVKISVKAAKVAYLAIQAGKDLKGYRIEGFTINSINSKTLTAGCHKIDMESIHRVGKELVK